MGMSASQARLLSITSRLTNNEFRSQTITNAKLRLATETTQATKKYNEALDSEMLMYMNYDNNGESSKVLLTPALLYEYAPLKNQYTLLNTAGKVLVAPLEAKNYEETDSLVDFLRRYNLVDDVETYETVKNKKTEQVEVPNPDYEDYIKKHPKPEITDSKYIIPGTPGINNFSWEIVPDNSGVSIWDKFYLAAQGCYTNAIYATTLDGSDNCYKHVLAHLIDLSIDFNCPEYSEIEKKYYYRTPDNTYPKTRNTTLGDSIEISVDDIEGSYIHNGINATHVYRTEFSFTPYLIPISDMIRDGYDPKDGTGVKIFYAYEHPSSDLDMSTAKEWQKLISDYYLPSINVNENPMSNDTKLKVLISNYKKDSNGSISIKTLHQKCIDMMYLIKNIKNLVPDKPETADKEYDIYYTEILVPLIKTFQEDMEKIFAGMSIIYHDESVPGTEDKIDEEQYKKDLDDWEKNKPEETILEEREIEYEEQIVKTRITINDKDKAQWYTNLWYKMNGSESSNLVRYKTKQADEYTTESFYTVDGAPKNSHGGEYALYDANLFEDANWLQFALEHGIVSMQKASFEKPCEDSERLLELASDAIYWNTIIHTSATDIVSVPDDDAVTRAEVEHKKALKKIHAEEKKLDTDLKKLDTEHSALQAEYDAIKETISKNVQRSFKMFS